jgi:hypothetical protein
MTSPIETPNRKSTITQAFYKYKKALEIKFEKQAFIKCKKAALLGTAFSITIQFYLFLSLFCNLANLKVATG